MIIILSPSKTMQSSKSFYKTTSPPLFLDMAESISEELKTLTFEQYSKLLKISGKIAIDSYNNMLLWEKIQCTPCLLRFFMTE